jgi:putative membrane-bound dehydrogenase-like protein
MKRFLLCSLVAVVSASAAEHTILPHRFTVPDGYTVEQVAAAPLVERPINMAFDDQGALYVSDSSGSNEKPDQQVKNPTHRVVRLVDKDGDGRFDQRTVFADKLSFPEGTMWLGGSLYVAAPPVIWKLTDTNCDGVADQREVWYDGKTLTGCANDLHGPYAGPDGFIYWCKGAFAEQRHRLADGRDFVTRASHLFRARPDGSGREVVMTGGMDNPVDVVFSPTGERFLCGTFFVKPAGGQRDGILHAVYGGVWGKEHGVLEGHARTGALMPIMTHLGPAAASGLEMLRSEALGFRGDLLCTQFNLRRVSRHTLLEDGATFRTKDADFLVSDQTDFHPTDVLEDKDGSVLIADTGGWYKLCCPTSKSEKPEVLGAIYRVRKTEPIPATADSPARALIEAAWQRIRSEDRAGIRTALRSSNVQVQAVAAYGAGLWRDRLARPDLLPLLGSADAHVRRAAAEALGRIGDKADVAALLTVKVQDRFSFHSVAYALFEIGQAPEGDGELARTVRAMLALPKPALSPASPLIAPAAKPDAATIKRQLARLDELMPLTQDGDARRGAELFRGAKALCATCHAIARDGGTFGPDLTKIGAIRTHRDLLEAIVFPSSSYVRSYEPLLVTLRSGDTQLGLLKDETKDMLVLANSPTTEVRIARAEVAALAEGPVSLMPPAFDGMLTPRELGDLIAFLKTAR